MTILSETAKSHPQGWLRLSKNYRFHYTFQKHRMITGVFNYLQSNDTKDVPIVTLR